MCAARGGSGRRSVGSRSWMMQSRKNAAMRNLVGRHVGGGQVCCTSFPHALSSVIPTNRRGVIGACLVESVRIVVGGRWRLRMRGSAPKVVCLTLFETPVWSAVRSREQRKYQRAGRSRTGLRPRPSLRRRSGQSKAKWEPRLSRWLAQPSKTPQRSAYALHSLARWPVSRWRRRVDVWHAAGVRLRTQKGRNGC
jgi:hypothetical protein